MPWWPGLAASAVLSACSAPPAVRVSAASSPLTCLKTQTLTYSSAQDAAALRDWTPARIDATRGFSSTVVGQLGKAGKPPRKPAGGWPASAAQCISQTGLSLAVGTSAPSTALPGSQADGYPAIGKLTFKADGVLGLNCTATVIQGTAATRNDDLILTAAHCIEGTIGAIPYISTDLAFSPGFHDNQSPFGTWTPGKVFIDSGWMHCSIPLVRCTTDPKYDYAVLVLNPVNGKDVGDLTGAYGWSINEPAAIRDAAIAGIPATSPGLLVRVADASTVTESGGQYREAATPGLTDGSSGGPWIRDFNAKTGSGVLFGDTGGFEQGGPSSGSPSFSDYWTTSPHW